MRLPLIKHINSFIAENDEDYVKEAIAVLEYLAESSAVKDDEIDVIGELLSNLYGGLEVAQMIKEGKTEKEAGNIFMKRVLGSIDQ
jgi:uncharacterized protein YerC